MAQMKAKFPHGGFAISPPTGTGYTYVFNSDGTPTEVHDEKDCKHLVGTGQFELVEDKPVRKGGKRT